MGAEEEASLSFFGNGCLALMIDVMLECLRWGCPEERWESKELWKRKGEETIQGKSWPLHWCSS